jgi:uncharacterized protein (DUF58 family)
MPPKSTQAPDPRIVADLSRLVALQFKARGFSFLPRQPVHSLLSGRHGSRIRGRGLNFEEIRAYRPGDDVRTIDWKVTARMRSPHSRVFTEERDRPVLLLVDQRIDMFFGSRLYMKSVTAAEAAALAAWRVLAVGDRVGALVFDDEHIEERRPLRSRNTVMQILRVITDMNQAMRADSHSHSNPAMLNQALEGALRLASHDHLLVIISDFNGADADSERMLTRLAVHNDVIAVLVHDPSAQDFPASQDLVATDGQLQLSLPLGHRGAREKIQAYSRGRIARILDWQRRLGVAVLPLDTGEEAAAQIQRLLGQAVGRRRSR